MLTRTVLVAALLTVAAPEAAATDLVVDYAGAAPTPAPAVPGARVGGQVTWLQDGAPGHLDPQQIYDVLDVARLFHRTLTGYIEDPNGGPTRLVGDLATNAGEPSADRRVWTYRLRDGISFDDGMPITSRDIGYGIARSFSDRGTFGPHYLQPALDPAGIYHGPYDGGADLPPGVSTPDDRTIVFTFADPHPELPYVLAMPTSTPVPKAKDTREGYDLSWVSSGPYRRASYVPGSGLLLERNPHWNPASDPIRHQYPDTIRFDWTVSRSSQTARLRAAAGDDAAAVMVDNVAQDQIEEVRQDPLLMARTLSGTTPTMKYININTSRVGSLRVRRAVNLAFDRAAYIEAHGGDVVAEPATTILAPTVPGHRAYDAYPRNLRRARELLRGSRPLLTMCLQDTEAERSYAGIAATALGGAGFRIVLRPIPAADYWATVGQRSTTCDLINSAWVGDFPDGDSTLRTTLDGNLLSDEGNVNFSYFDDPCVNSELERLAGLTDRGAAATLYGELDERIMRDHAPLVPTVNPRVFSLHGPRVGGVFLSELYGRPYLTDAFVR